MTASHFVKQNILLNGIYALLNAPRPNGVGLKDKSYTFEVLNSNRNLRLNSYFYYMIFNFLWFMFTITHFIYQPTLIF